MNDQDLLDDCGGVFVVNGTNRTFCRRHLPFAALLLAFAGIPGCGRGETAPADVSAKAASAPIAGDALKASTPSTPDVANVPPIEPSRTMGTAGESKPSPPVIAVSEPPNASAAADEAVAELTAEEPKPAPQRQIAAAPLAVGATLATALPCAPPEPFAFSSDPLGKLEAERLPPPRRVPLENFPWVKEPQSTALRFPDVVLARLWSFPMALPGGESRSLPIEHPAIARTLPTLDRPTLPAFTPELAPQQPEFVIALRTRVASPRQDEVPAPPATLQPFEPKAVAQDDPGHATAWRLLLTPLAFLDPIAAAPERGGIPDPYDHLRAVRWQSPPAEAMAPSVSYARPAPLTLPVEK